MRILIVSPHFPPTNAADMQRVRLLLPYLRLNGVQAEVLCVESSQVAAPQDDWLGQGQSSEVRVHRVRALGLCWGRIPGFGTLTFRALGVLRNCGDTLLSRGGFDLVFFSTTQFGLHVLGPRWKTKFGVPFVMDYQDPWVSDYYSQHPEVVPPGGRLKYAISSRLSRCQEPRVLRHCSGITSVSAAYPRLLQARYPWLDVVEEKQIFFKQIASTTPFSGARGQESENVGIRCAALPTESGASSNFPVFETSISGPPEVGRHRLPSLVIPFPGDRRDLDRIKLDGIRQHVFDPNDGYTHWVYVGRGGGDMALAVRSLFLAFQISINSQPATPTPSLHALRLHFIGTSYAAAGRGKKTIESLAAEFGLERMVIEDTDRIPYSQTLRCLLDADALIVPGSDDPGYTASKIYPYLLAEKPLLTVFHEESSVLRLVREVGGAVGVSFRTGESPVEISQRIRELWLDSGAFAKAVPLDEMAFEPYTAAAQAQQLGAFFQTVLDLDGPF